MANGVDTRRSRPFTVAIIGSGFGGIAAAVKLQKRTKASFVIFEQAGGLGGTWFDNRYPGCEVDIPSHAYSFSFLKYDWARTHATQPELLAYAEQVVDRFGLRARIRLDTRIAEVRWIDDRSCYEVRTEAGETMEFDAVISAVGLLNVPSVPGWASTGTFAGPMFHTSRWDPEHDFHGKRVAVVGTGSTAAQVVPALAPIVSELTVYQRQPGWVQPKHERPFTRTERFVLRRVPLAQRLRRGYLFLQGILRFGAHDVKSPKQQRMRELCEAYIAASVRDPETRRHLTPDYPWGCKRTVVASNYYPAFNRPNVTLVPHAVVSATRTGLVDDTGQERAADVVVLSTGFQPTRFLANLRVVGRDGVELHDVWSERASAFLGITVPGFPNFFILYGPNTNGGMSIIAQLERQAEVAARAVARLTRRGHGVVDTDAEAARRWVLWIDRQLDRHASVMNAGCTNYYHVEGGANVTQWPRTHLIYLLCTRFLWRKGLRFSRARDPERPRRDAEPALAGTR